ncbi:MAG: transcription antitermination factor NusB [Treponema sp.]|jgi:N utilization substance protein B|nr:transcription antitermination factor NusB [Treponema sp.]
MASRRKGRILAFQALYSYEAASAAAEDLLNFSWLEAEKQASLDEGTANFARLLIRGAIENIDAVDAMIRAHLKNWVFSRVSRVDLALLRISVYTLMYQEEIAPSIVIDEAIGISREYGADDSYRFINGVLDSIRRTLQEQRPLHTGDSPAELHIPK